MAGLTLRSSVLRQRVSSKKVHARQLEGLNIDSIPLQIGINITNTHAELF